MDSEIFSVEGTGLRSANPTAQIVCRVDWGKLPYTRGGRLEASLPWPYSEEVWGRTRGDAWGPGFITKGRRLVREGGPRPSARVGGNYGQAERWLWGFLSVLG